MVLDYKFFDSHFVRGSVRAALLNYSGTHSGAFFGTLRTHIKRHRKKFKTKSVILVYKFFDSHFVRGSVRAAKKNRS